MSTPPHAFAASPTPANDLWGDDWAEVRAMWPLEPSVDHLNHGGFGAVLIPALDEQQSWRARMEENPARFFTRELPDALELARGEVAQFLGAENDGVAFVTNVTSGVSTALAALDLRPDDEVVVTDHAFGAVHVAAERFAARARAGVRVAAVELEADDEAVVAAVLAEVGDRTRLVCLDAVTSPTARRMPTERIIAALAGSGIAVLVDAAHAPGMVDVVLREERADFWVGNLHTWCCAPRGTAVLAVAPQWRSRVTPLVVSWNGEEAFPDAFGVLGSADYTAWLAAPRALRSLNQLGLDRVRQHNAALARDAQHRIAAALGLDPSALPNVDGLSMRLVPLPGGVAENRDQARALQKHIAESVEVEVGVTTWRGAGYLRLSAHAYNAPTDYDRLGRYITQLL